MIIEEDNRSIETDSEKIEIMEVVIIYIKMAFIYKLHLIKKVK